MVGKRFPEERKIAFLKAIQERKDVLFGKFSDELDKKKKVDGWKEVLNVAKSLELAPESKDFAYARDQLWGVWKSRALQKKDNKGKTGKPGGKENVMGEVDKLIIDIIGAESPVVEGLPMGESGRRVLAQVDENENQDDILDDFENPEVSPTSRGRPTSKKNRPPMAPAGSTPTSRPFKRRGPFVDPMIKKKRELQCDLLEVTLYKERLQCLKLEKKLDLPRSVVTRRLFEDDEELM